jgi:DNA-directed RNA polymerase specialized sigma24 family protein
MKVSKASQKINGLYDAYKQNPEEGLEPLLEEVYSRASCMFGDDDAVQNFIISLVDKLPDLVITKSFNAWLYRQLRWRSIDMYRSIRAGAKREVTPFPITDELGQELSLNESLGVLEFEADQAIGDDIGLDTKSIADPAVQKIADLLIMGYRREEIAAMLGKTVGALKVRISRYRQNKKKMAA